MVFDQEKMQKEKEKLLRINNDMKNIKMAIIIALAIVSCALLLYTWALKRENDLILQENFKTRELLDDTKVKLTECQKSANK